MSDLILALDTSSGTRTALVSDGRVLASRTQLDARAHAEHATPMVEQVLAEAGLAVGDLTAVAVGTGPAPFTGLRVGLATAQLLALAVDLPVWGVPSLDAWAAGAFDADPGLDRVLVATDARRREVYQARYVRDTAAPGGLRRDGDFAVHRPDPHAGPVTAVGTGTALYPEAYPLVVAGVDLDPRHLADLALARTRAGEAVPLTPLYLRRPDVHGVPGGREPLAPATGANAPEGTMTTVQMRALETRDLDRVEELEPELFGVGAWSRQTYEQELGRTDRVYLAAVDPDGVLLGYGGVALDPEWTIMTVGVAPHARRRGVATALLDALVDAVREARGTELFLEVRAHDGGAQQLYRNAGFVRVGLRRRYYQPEGADAVVMRLSLARRVGAVGAEVTSAPADPTGPDEALGVHATSTAPGAGQDAGRGGGGAGAEDARGAVFVDVDALHTAVWSERPPTLLDVRWALGRDDGREVYARGHLPGAVFVDLDAELAGTPSPEAGRHPLPEAEELQAAARRWGVSAGSSVVVYDDAGGTSAARAWWLLRWAGVRDVRILDGGLRAWVAAGHHLEDGFVRPRPGDVVVRPGALRTVGADDVADHPGIVLDARDHERFTGEVEPVDPRAGHVPGAVSAPTRANLSSDGWLLEPDELRERFDALGVRTGVDVAVYCGSGVTAAHQVAVLASLGVDAALYPGSFSQWSNDPGREVATGE